MAGVHEQARYIVSKVYSYFRRDIEQPLCCSLAKVQLAAKACDNVV
jgi:hypothetical protein